MSFQMGTPIVCESVKNRFMRNPDDFTLEEGEEGTIYITDQSMFPLLCILVGSSINDYSRSFVGDGSMADPHRLA